MERPTFEREMRRAEVMRELGDRAEYWLGFQRGLRRQFHGEKFGTESEHVKWMSLADDPTESRAERGSGYRDGFAFGSDPRIPTTPTKSRCDACGAAYNGCPLHRAAPALLAACERTLRMLTHLTTEEYARGADREMRDILTAALKLAKGE